MFLGKFGALLLGTGLSSTERVGIPILDKLIPNGIKPGTIFTVQYDPESQWLAVATTIAARHLQVDGRVGYVVNVRSREDVMQALSAQGVDVQVALNGGRLLIDDAYSATLTSGRLDPASPQIGVFEPIEGGVRWHSLKVADLSIEWLKQTKHGPQPWDVGETWPPGALSIGESESEILRFNEENPYVEWTVSRTNPIDRKAGRISLQGLVRGVHSESLYKRIEAAMDGVIDIRVMEQQGESKSFLRIRSLKGQPYDGRWHEIEIKPNGEAILRT